MGAIVLADRAPVSEAASTKLAAPGLELEARTRASTMHVIYKTISAELEQRLAEGFDDPAAEQRDRMVSTCLDMAARYREAVQALALLIPQVSPDTAAGYQIALGMMEVFAQVLESMALATTPEVAAAVEPALEAARSGLRDVGDLSLLGMHRRDETVQ